MPTAQDDLLLVVNPGLFQAGGNQAAISRAISRKEKGQ
jgi:hypothetical protein